MSYPPEQPKPGINGATMVAGALSFIFGNAVFGFLALMIGGSLADRSGIGFEIVPGFVAVVGIAVAFGVGGVLTRKGDRDKRGWGVGLMVGWALVSMLTVGFCTGLNPVLYQ
ncbi:MULTISPECIES: hypothetical protein [Mycobacteroides]|jgi:hypothetical protein|uniref:DUF4190 domain-containing protein n=2 Tax=Mycobacteroides chelonae TaxID=1774 RepID=A0AB73U640_MYCCH|nr:MULTISPECIES: hypothetical protein [Mycobacteroides]AMW21614.1 hypothetical protein Chelonae_p3863 [Mycobacterium sp. QIA-37]SKL94445.1 Uncharacterised protein [Mycobacteroides abscessus subsp. bolletii]AYM43700.1 hypothetical protein DYE20_21130 [[Mycobacterium] chelonae subsp. gwanakae]KRQ28395.1 hypothetical protein AOT86_08175 [Mycobacteroides sp. H072]KRQ70604.1 hypothetical protein AOT83_10685 [Mycobacteroides sp. H001]